jgi:hypothetical protein
MIVLAAALTVAMQQEPDQEQRVTRRDLPAAVARTVDAQARGATIRGFSKEREHGQTFYEVELRVNGHTKDVLIDTTGAVVEVEEQVDIATLPAPVREALMAAAGSGKLRSVESVMRGGQTAYEGHVNTNGKWSEIKVGPDGKPLH